MVKIIDTDQEEINKELVGMWQVHNGKKFVHGYPSKDEAVEACKRLKGVAVCKLEEIDGKVYHTQAERVG